MNNKLPNPFPTYEALLTHVRALKAKGLPRPHDVPEDVWNEAGPYSPSSVSDHYEAALQYSLRANLPAELPKEPNALLSTLFGPAVATALDVLFNGQKDSDRLAASKMLIEYHVGKPEQKVTHTGSLALEVHQQTTKIVEALKSGTIIDVDNLLAKPLPAVENFLDKHMPERFVVGQKEATNGKAEQGTGEGLPQGVRAEAYSGEESST